jgi:hypothetical protein
LIAQGGFGITLPLQLKLAAEVSWVASDMQAAVINACYPDAVNVVLDRVDLRMTCGLGNAAIIEAFCRSKAGAGKKDMRIVAHHGHVGPWLRGKNSASQPRVWVQGREVPAHQLQPDLGAIGEELNSVTTSTAIPLLLSFLSGAALRTSIPGIAGLPGGYPFLLKLRKFSLCLPPDLTPAQAIAHNKNGERLDGLDLATDAKFVGKAHQALQTANFEYAQGFSFSEWTLACQRMESLRDRLRNTE